MKYLKRVAYASAYTLAAYTSLMCAGTGCVFFYLAHKASSLSRDALKGFTRNV